MWALTMLVLAFTLYGLMRLWRRRTAVAPSRQFAPPVQGLTEAEALARRPTVDLDALIEDEQKQFLRRAIRENLFTIFNLDLIGIAILMGVLGSPLSTLTTLFVLLLNVVLNVSQEVVTKRRLDALMQSIRPQATVIRDGRIRSVDPIDVVQGDVLVVGPGDQILVDGEILADGEITVDEFGSDQGRHQYVKRAGDTVLADSLCITGRALYRATNTELNRLLAAETAGVEVLSHEYTPLQQLINGILRSLFLLVIPLSAVLVIDAVGSQIGIVSEQYRAAFSIVFGIAPTSLFFVLIVSYAVGSLRMAELGGLVYRSQTIEFLAGVSVLCLNRRSVLSGIQVTLEPFTEEEQETFSEPLMRRMLGDVVHSVPVDRRAGLMLADAIDGDRRTPVEVASFMSIYGWYGISFNDVDRRGTYILGEPAVLQSHLVTERTRPLEEIQQTLSETKRGVSRWRERLLRRNSTELPATPNGARPAAEPSPPNAVTEEDGQQQPSSFLQRLRSRLEPLMTAQEDLQPDETRSEQSDERLTYLFAYVSEIVPLAAPDGRPQLPTDLIPLGHVYVSEAILPEATDTIRALQKAGVHVKLLATEPPERVAQTAQALGLEADTVVSGPVLAELNEADFAETVRSAPTFAQLTPEEKANILKSLRAQGESVAMVGYSAGDVPAMREANVRIALQSSSQAALAATDLVMLQNSLARLPQVLRAGQRLVSSLLDTFKLNLSQIISQLLLIIFIMIFGLRQFPYHPTQGGVLVLFTITIPNIFLVFWASAETLSTEKMRRRLVHFVIPAAITLAVLAMSVYELSVRRTGNIAYAHLTVTYALLGAGWLRVLFVQPPTPFWVGGAELSGDRRVIRLVIGTVAVFFIVLLVPIFREWLRIDFLQSSVDYVWVVGAATIWALSVRTIWRSGTVRRYLAVVAARGRTP